MKCHIPGPNVKGFYRYSTISVVAREYQRSCIQGVLEDLKPSVLIQILGRTIHALARFGDELYLESLVDCLILKTLNAAESAYAMVKFNKNFFSYFNYDLYTTDDNEGLKCKISMKTALNIFKSPIHMDKQVDNLEIKLDPDSCKLIFQLKCKQGIVKTHYVSILDCKALQTVYTKDQVPNRITVSQRMLTESLGNFQSSDDQVTLEASTQSLLLRNYTDSNIHISKIIRTQICIKPLEFESYIIGYDTIITFTLKELRALLAFAEALTLPIQLHFETTGKPAVFIIHNGTTFEANFVLATSKPDLATQTTQNRSRTEKKRKESLNDNEGSARKKSNISADINCLDEDSNLFNLVDIAEQEICPGNVVNVQEHMDCDNIPASPTSRFKIKSVFKRCFESTFDPRNIQRVVLAENSDSD